MIQEGRRRSKIRCPFPLVRQEQLRIIGCPGACTGPAASLGKAFVSHVVCTVRHGT